MRNFLLILSVFWLWTCSGGDKATGPEEAPIIINLTSLGGQAQKGPFNNGTAINIAELTNTLSPTGRNFSSAITDNTGRFAVANVQLESPYVELRANGYYFNEVTDKISSGQLTLFALSDLTGKTSLNVNILTHLEKNRIVTLMSGDNPKTFAQAKLQAQEEVLAIFDYSRANVPESELLDISQDGAANAKLLAMSAIIQGNLNTGQMSELLANISTDIASDGTLDDTNLRNTLIENSKNLDIAEVRSNLEARYVSLGITATIPDFETEINKFLKPPVAQDMSASTGEDTSINITLSASDPEGESLTYTIVEFNNATVTLNGNVANYTPNANFNGTDTFTYKANDGTSDSNIATVTMTVSGEDDDPNTQNAAATTDEDVAVVLQLAAEEYDGDSYSFGIISNPSNGSVSLDGANATYTPNQDYNGTDSFTFEATDDTGRMMNVGTATITINPVNDAPVLTTSTVSVSVDEEQSVSFTIDATDIDGDQLTFIATNQDAQNQPIVIDGTVDTNGNTYIYTPYSDGSYELSEGASREDFFYYYAQDSSGEKTQYGSAYINVTGVDDLPHANDMSVFTPENKSLDILLSSTDPDGGDSSGIQYEIISNPNNGSVALNESTATYSPNSNFHGNDSFTYKVIGDSSIGTVSIIVNEVVGDLTIFPDLVEGYSERFSDIVYDVSNGGYIVAGYTHNKNDSSGPPWGEGGTWKMFKLSVDSFIDTQFYETLDYQRSPVWYNPKQNSVHGFDISRVSHDGNYILSMWNDYLWSVDSSGNSVFNQFSGSIESGYNWIDNISNIFQLNDGTFIILGAVRKGDFSTSEKYPIIAVIDQNLNILDYEILDNHITDSSLKYDSYYNRMVYNHNDGVVYVIAQTNIIGFNNSNHLNYYEVGLDAMASNFTVNRYENLSDISGSPTQMYIQGENSDVMTYKRNPNGYDEFILMTEEDSSDQLMLVYYRLMDNGSKEIVETFYPNHSGSHDFMEFVDSGNRYYLVAQENNDIRVQSVFDTENFGTQFDKLIDITGSGYEDRLGGATATNFYNNGSGLAITGSTRKDSTEDWDGFILLLDLNGD